MVFKKPVPSSSTSQQWPQYLVALSAGLMAVSSGIQNGWPAPSVPKLLSNELDITITKEEMSYILMVGPLGFLLGSPLGGFLLNRVGRKRTLMIFAIPQLINWISMITCKHVAQLYISRFLGGMFDGGLFTSLPVYLCEIAETNIRGVIGASHSGGMITGQLLINIYGSYLSINIAAWISICFPIVFLITFAIMPDSPYYLLLKGKEEEARESLRKLRWMENVEVELHQLTLDVERQQSEPGYFRDIFKIKSNAKAFLILIVLRTIQQYSGIIVLSYYSQVIFKKAEGPLNAAQSSILCTIVKFLTVIFGAPLLDKFGRKPIFGISTLGSMVLLFGTGIFFSFQSAGYDVYMFSWVPLICMMLYFMIGGLGLLMVPNLMGGEIFSSSIKSKVLSIQNMYLGLCLSAVIQVFQILETSAGMQTPFFVFGAVCLAGFFFNHLYVVETKGRSLEEIQQVLKNGDNVNENNIPRV